MRCAFPSRFPSTTRQHKVHRLRCIAERLGHGVHVRVHREPDCGVPEDCLNGFRINASGHKKGRSRVAQVMEPYFLIGEAGQFVCLAHLRVLGDQWRRPALGPDAYRHPPFPTGDQLWVVVNSNQNSSLAAVGTAVVYWAMHLISG